jgi:hypothetical protein
MCGAWEVAMVTRWESEAERIREAIAALGPRGRTQRLPEAIRRRVLLLMDRGRQAGASWQQLAAAVNLSVSTLHHWQATAGARYPEAVMVPVTVQAAPPMQLPPVSALVLVTASGHRLEGLHVAEAVMVLRALA